MVINRETIRKFGIFLILLVPFTKSLFRTLYGGNTGVIIVLFIGISMVLLSQIYQYKIKIKITFMALLWLGVLIIAICNNYDWKNGNKLAVIQILIITFLMIILQNDDSWCIDAIKITKIFTLFYLITGVILLFFKNALIRYIVPLFKLDASSDYYSSNLIQQINNGYMTGLTAHYSTMGIYMSIGMCFFAGNIFNDKDKIEKQDLIGLAVMLIGTFLCGKRSALLFPTIAVLIVYFSYFKPKKASRRYNYIAFMIIAILFMLMLMTMIPGLGGAIGRITSILGSTDLNDITNKRYEMLWLPAIKLFLDSPIFGIGWGNFKYSFTKYYIYTANQNNTHNVYLQLLCETGIIGFVITMSAMLVSAISIGRILTKWRKNKIYISKKQLSTLGIALAMQLYFFLYSFSGNPLYDIQSYYPYMIGVIMGISTVRKIKVQNRKIIME